MKLTLTILLATLILLTMPVQAGTRLYTNSNLPFSYPDHKCYKPLKPLPIYSFQEKNYAAIRYKNNLQEYKDCINIYVQATKNDIKRLQKKIMRIKQ